MTMFAGIPTCLALSLSGQKSVWHGAELLEAGSWKTWVQDHPQPQKPSRGLEPLAGSPLSLPCKLIFGWSTISPAPGGAMTKTKPTHHSRSKSSFSWSAQESAGNQLRIK
uniref:Uncharacterized protein n=1 Tax=Micrurus lemniscatus lemniscatus TaxID=129467 RepID=A0A2D4HKS7_MICLE